MSAHVLLNLLNEFAEKISGEVVPSILSVSPNEFLNAVIQEHECKILCII